VANKHKLEDRMKGFGDKCYPCKCSECGYVGLVTKRQKEGVDTIICQCRVGYNVLAKNNS